MKGKFGLLLLSAATLIGSASCGAATSANADVVVSFYPFFYLAKRICGDRLSVASIVPRGSEPHDFELRTSDVMTLHDAKAIFLNGLQMEPCEDAIKGDDSLAKKTTVLGDSLDSLIEVKSEARGTYIDPHVWLDPIQCATMGLTMLELIITISPENEAFFRTNYASLKADLEGLVAYGGDKLVGKTIAVSHDAFRYMGRRFGFSELYINGFSPDDEPTASALQTLLDAVKEKGIDTIFFEELGNQDIAAYIAEQTGAKVEVLSPLETVEDGQDYLSAYHSNIDKIAGAKSK